MFKLPTRGHTDRPYRGKYPTRICQWSYSGSPASKALGVFLGIKRPVHIELNEGTRYIADLSEVKADETKIGTELNDFLVHVPTHVVTLTQERYDQMLAIVRAVRNTENAR